MPVRLHHAPPQDGSEKPPAKALPEAAPTPAAPATATLPSPAPDPIRAPAVLLKPRIPLESERRRMRTLRLGLAALAVLGLGWAMKRVLWPHRVSVPGTLVLSERAVESEVDGTVTRAPAPGSRVEAGALCLEITLDPSGAADLARLQAQLARAEKTLSAAMANQVEVERAYRSQRASRSEREDAFRLARDRERERDDLKAQLAARGAPSGPPVALPAPVGGWVVDPVPAGTRVTAGTALARILAPHVRAEAAWSGSTRRPGSKAFVRLGSERLPAMVVESPPGKILVELDLTAPVPNGTAVTLELP